MKENENNHSSQQNIDEETRKALEEADSAYYHEKDRARYEEMIAFDEYQNKRYEHSRKKRRRAVRRQVLLVVLLVLAGGYGASYLYFGTEPVTYALSKVPEAITQTASLFGKPVTVNSTGGADETLGSDSGSKTASAYTSSPEPSESVLSGSGGTTASSSAEVTLTPTVSTDPSLEKYLQFSPGDWNLILINTSNPLPEDYNADPVDIGQESVPIQINSRVKDSLNQMLADCRSAGCDPLVCSGYRDRAYQQELFDNSVKNYEDQGLSEEDAIKKTSEAIAIPGSSEHESGLAADIVDISNQNLDENQQNTETQKWLLANSWKYGWTLRYPDGNTHVTGIEYEPWHYRFVGKDAARIMYEENLCLEDFLAKINEAKGE